MKLIKLIIIGIVLLSSTITKAQVSVNINIGTPPPWGPAGYTETRYYYLPDVEAYYDVQTSMFIYYGGGTWVHRSYLPGRYRNYDLYNGYKVVMVDYNGSTPYTHFKEHKMKYAKGYRGEPQRSIREKPGRGNAEGQKMDRGGHHDNNNHTQKGQGHNGNSGGKGKHR